MKSYALTMLLVLSLIANGIFLIGKLRVQETVSGEVHTDETPSYLDDMVPYESGISYPLMRIIDGDTLVIGFNGTTEYVRLIGIDAPEPNDPGGPQCYAQEATLHLQELARTGLVVLHFDESQGMRDSYGRLLAYVELPDGTDLGKQMVEDGYAHEFTYKAAYERQEDYMTVEQAALEEVRGLWSEDICQ